MTPGGHFEHYYEMKIGTAAASKRALYCVQPSLQIMEEYVWRPMKYFGKCTDTSKGLNLQNVCM